VELAGLHAEIDRLQVAELCVDPAVLGAEIVELERAAHRLMAEKSRRLEAFDRAQGYEAEQQTSTRSWLRTQTLSPHGQAAAEEAVARIRGKLPALTAAWQAGQTTFGHVRVVETVLRQLPQVLWPEVDEPITEHARDRTAAEFATWLRELAQTLAPTPKPREETQHDSRRLSLSQGFNGMTNLVGRLTPEAAEKLHAALSAASRPDAAGELRLPNQRRADALEAVLDQVLDAGTLPADGGQKPHLTLAVDLDRLTEAAQQDEQQPVPDLWTLSVQELTVRVADGAAAADAATDPASGRPRYSWTGPTTIAAARRLTCDGQLLPIFTRNGQPLDVGRTTRLISPALRALIVARDQHCRWPGCGMPARWTQVHHVVHWRDGGRTDRANLILLCSHHHHAAHDGRWTVIQEAPGEITVRRRQRPDDPYYEIRNPQPPPPRPSLDVKGERRAAAGHAC
jgi:hypothetical protein